MNGGVNEEEDRIILSIQVSTDSLKDRGVVTLGVSPVTNWLDGISLWISFRLFLGPILSMSSASFE